MSSEVSKPLPSDKKGGKGPSKGRGKDVGPPKKKFYKLVVRKLPLSNYDHSTFQNDLEKFCAKLQLAPESFRFEHFIQGKLSRQRGPVPGVGFFSTDEDAAKIVLTNSQQVPFYEGDMNQSDVFLALNQSMFKAKERMDKVVGTFESDPEYLAFVAREEAPPQKRVSAEVLLDQKAAAAKAALAAGTPVSPSSVVNDPRQSALLCFLRERSESRRRVGKGAAGAKRTDKKDSRKDRDRDRDRKERPKKEKEREKEKGRGKREGRSKRASAAAAAKQVVEGGGGGGAASLPHAVKILTKVRILTY